MKTLVLSSILVLLPMYVSAQETEPAQVDPDSQECISRDEGRCLTTEQILEIKKGIQELDDIHNSPAILTTEDAITIIQDWDGRVYTNGGSAEPIRFKLKIGQTIERDIDMVLQTEFYHRPEPPEPMFRLRIRAQVGLLALQVIRTLEGDKKSYVDGGIGWDIFHIDVFNAGFYTGVLSSGIMIGMDLTKNFGVNLAPVIVYDGLQFSIMAGVYFSF